MERSPHDTHHSVEDDWPLALGINERGQSIHVCADCRQEIPDGVSVVREDGRVIAFSVDPATDERTVHHDCEGSRG